MMGLSDADKLKQYKVDTCDYFNGGIVHVQECLGRLTDSEFKSLSRQDVIKLIDTMKVKG